MKSFPKIFQRCDAYTLLELMVGVATASAIFAIILTSGVAIYRSCTAADDYSMQTNRQLRAIDYISRDLRCAHSAAMPAGAMTLSLTIPDCYAAYDDGGIPTGAPVDPEIVDGNPVYGDAAQPIAVNYYVADSALIREQTVPATGQITRLVVATDVTGFELNFVPLSTLVKFTISFAARQHQGITGLRPGAQASATVAARMLRLK